MSLPADAPSSGSGALVDLVVRAFEAWNAGDIDGVCRLYHPDARIHGTPPLARAAMYRGHDGLRTFAAEAAETYVEFKVTARTMHELDAHRVLVLGAVTGQEVSGRRFDLEAAYVYTFDDDGLVAELRTFIRPELAQEQEFEPFGDRRGRAHGGTMLGRWGDEPRALLALDDGTTVEVDCPESLACSFEPGERVVAYLEAGGQVQGWYLERTGKGVDQRGGEE